MSRRQRVFSLELDEHGTPQLSEAAAKSDQSSHKNLIKRLRDDLTRLGNDHPRTNIVVVIESGYSGRISVAEARHSSNDKAWQDDLLYAIIKAMKYKSRNASKPLSEFNFPTPERAGLEDTLDEAVRLGVLGNLMRRILLDVSEDLVKKHEKEARKSERNAQIDWRKFARGPAALATEGDPGSGERAAGEGPASWMLAAGEGAGGGPGDSGGAESEEEGSPAAFGRAADLSAEGAPPGIAGAAAAAPAEVQAQEAVQIDGGVSDGDAIEDDDCALELAEPAEGHGQAAGGAVLEEGAEQAAGEAGPSQPAVRKTKRNEEEIKPQEREKMATIAEEIHRAAFLERKAKAKPGEDLAKARIPFSKETREKMLNLYPEGSADRSRIERILHNDQAVLNLFQRGKTPVTAAGFAHVKEYTKDKKEALAAMAAAVAAHDRVGAFNVPLANATEADISSWMDGFMEAHTQMDSAVRQRTLKAPTVELKEAIPKILQRSVLWMAQHSTLRQKIIGFQGDLGTALDLARV